MIGIYLILILGCIPILGSTANQDIEFYLDKPSLPGTYGLYAESNTDLGYTNYLSLGDPYVGVSLANGILQFSDQSAYDNLVARWRQPTRNIEQTFLIAMTIYLKSI